MNWYAIRGKKVLLSFRDADVTDEWAEVVETNSLGITVKPINQQYAMWFYPWTSIQGFRLDTGEPPVRSA